MIYCQAATFPAFLKSNEKYQACATQNKNNIPLIRILSSNVARKAPSGLCKQENKNDVSLFYMVGS